MVRVARVTPGYPTPDSYKLAAQQALAVVPWMPDYYSEVRGEELGPELYGGRLSKIARYSNGENLTPRKRAEIRLARLLLADGQPISREEIEARLAHANRAEEAATKMYKTAVTTFVEPPSPKRSGELRIVQVG
jgi:hypothetical protein